MNNLKKLNTQGVGFIESPVQKNNYSSGLNKPNYMKRKTLGAKTKYMKKSNFLEYNIIGRKPNKDDTDYFKYDSSLHRSVSEIDSNFDRMNPIITSMKNINKQSKDSKDFI